eukprot:5252989-Amphidinium_carterae.2
MAFGHFGGAFGNEKNAHISYEGGMPTKQLPTKLAPSRQCEDWSDDEALDLTGMWIALKRNNFRVAASLNSPIEASLPPGSMVRVIGPTVLVGDIVRAFVELAAPCRKGTTADMGFISLRALRPEGPVFYRPARASDRIFLRDVVPVGLNNMGTKRLVWKWQLEDGSDLPVDQPIDSSLDSSTPGTPPPPPTTVWRWSHNEPEKEVTHRPETQEFLFNTPGHTQRSFATDLVVWRAERQKLCPADVPEGARCATWLSWKQFHRGHDLAAAWSLVEPVAKGKKSAK